MTELAYKEDSVILCAPDDFVPTWSKIHNNLKNTNPQETRKVLDSLEQQNKVYSWMSEKCIVGEAHEFDDSYCNTRTVEKGFCRYCIRMSRTSRMLYAVHGTDQQFINYKNHLYTHMIRYHKKDAA